MGKLDLFQVLAPVWENSKPRCKVHEREQDYLDVEDTCSEANAGSLVWQDACHENCMPTQFSCPLYWVGDNGQIEYSGSSLGRVQCS